MDWEVEKGGGREEGVVRIDVNIRVRNLEKLDLISLRNRSKIKCVNAFTRICMYVPL